MNPSFIYPFMEIKNSSLLLVLERRSCINSIASMGFMSAKCLLKTHILFRISLSKSKSSRLVPEEIRSIAGQILRLAIFLSNCISMFPVPLNSSKITSSILEPVSVNAVAIIESDPPFSIFLAEPKNLFVVRIVAQF